MAIKIKDANGNVKTVAGGGSSGVSSFKGRSGAVVPKAGDYTAEMVGAATMEQVEAAIQKAISDSWEAEY